MTILQWYWQGTRLYVKADIGISISEIIHRPASTDEMMAILSAMKSADPTIKQFWWKRKRLMVSYEVKKPRQFSGDFDRKIKNRKATLPEMQRLLPLMNGALK